MQNHRSTVFVFLYSSIFLLFPYIANAAQAADSPIAQGIYEIVCAADSAFILDQETCTVKETASHTVQLYRCLDINQQKFYVETLPGCLYRISNLYSSEALTADEASEEVSMDTLQRSAGSAALSSQSWILSDTGDGRFYICSRKTGLYLTLDSDFAYNGAPVSLESFTGSSRQKWTFKKTWISSDDTADTDLINPYDTDGQYHNLRLIIRCGAGTEILTGEDIANWMQETESHQLILDSDQLTQFVEELAQKYDTQGQPRNFRTSWGKEITLYKGNFGWKLDVQKTIGLLQDNLNTEGSVILKPIWSHKGGTFSKGNDIGDSYVEVDLINQKVWLYKDGEKLLETGCVSGTLNTERQTPGGVYSIYYKQSPAVLNGPGYSSPVEYWMPFNGGIGLHDANWRSTFGGDIYKTNGSHGCINLPTDAAKLIYETVEIGYPVVCYN